MDYGNWADATALTHFLTIIFVVVGLLVSFRYKRFRPWEAGILIVVVILWSYYGNCPLTILEQHLRDLAGEQSNIASVGFLPYYFNKILAIDFPSRIVQRFTFFTGGALFAASIEWISPYMHLHLFHLRRSLKRLGRRFAF